MSGLPFDIARCPGTTAPLCQQCRRREPGRPEWQAYIAPSSSSSGCQNYIEPYHDYQFPDARKMIVVKQ